MFIFSRCHLILLAIFYIISVHLYYSSYLPFSIDLHSFITYLPFGMIFFHLKYFLIGFIFWRHSMMIYIISFCLYENVFISPPFLKNISPVHTIFDSSFFIAMKISFHCVLALIVEDNSWSNYYSLKDKCHTFFYLLWFSTISL